MGTRGRVPFGFMLVLWVAVVGSPLAAVPARADTGTATFTASYDSNVPDDVRVAVDHAMGIWAQRVHSSVPIEVEVRWGGGLPENVASATQPGGYARVTPGGPLQAVALANAAAGFDREPSSPDIRMLLGSGIRWYTGLDGAAPAWATDMVSMVLHELAHGLGFIGSFRSSSSGLGWGRAAAGELVPVGLDTGLVDNRVGAHLTDTAVFANPSDALHEAATSRQVVWGGGALDSHGRAPVMYAPSSYEPHSSLMHFDDDVYEWGDPDALMTSLIKRGEVIHRIGPATLGVLRDLGWQVNAESGSSSVAPRSAAAKPAPRVRPQAASPVAKAAPATTAVPVVATLPSPPTPPTSALVAAPIVVPALKDGAPLGGVVRTDPVAVAGVMPLVAVAIAIERFRRRQRNGASASASGSSSAGS